MAKSGWDKKLKRHSGETRRKIYDRAVRMLINTKTNPNERETSIRQLQAAVKIDPAMLFEAIMSVFGSHASSEEIEKLKKDLTAADSKFDALVASIQTLRASLEKHNIVEANARMPETIQDWDAAIEAALHTRTHRLEEWEARLNQQKEELQTIPLLLKKGLKRRRDTILAEIEKAQELFRQSVPIMDKSARAIDSATAKTETEIAKALRMVGDLFVSYEIGQQVEGKGIYFGTWKPPVGILSNNLYRAYAAPQDLRTSKTIFLTFEQAAKKLMAKHRWHSHNGLSVSDDDIENGYEKYW